MARARGLSVSRRVLTNTLRVSLPLNRAIRNAASAPTAELSSSDVRPEKNEPITERTSSIGSIPARSTRSFSAQLKLRCSFGSTGPSFGLMRQRTTT